MNKLTKTFTILIFLFMTFAKISYADKNLSIDISKYILPITTDFTGEKVILFGTANIKGELLILVTGPKTKITVRKKENNFGIWMNGTSLTFKDVPNYYYITSSVKKFRYINDNIAKTHQIGIDNINAVAEKDNSSNDVFKQALFNNLKEQGLYTENYGEVKKRGRYLFKTVINFPKNVPTGVYKIQALLVDKTGSVVASETVPLSIRKVGISERIFFAAHNYSALYGIMAIIIAIIAGLTANAVFNRRRR